MSDPAGDAVLDGLDFIPRLLCDTCDDRAVGSIALQCPRCRETTTHIVCQSCEAISLGLLVKYFTHDLLGCTSCHLHFARSGLTFSDVMTWERLT